MENDFINGYILKYRLGEGGMAEVWYAENALQKPAAIKVLLKKFCDEPDIVARFENEAKLMVQLNHPHIRNIQDYGIINERPCMVMEYLEGTDLSKRMKKGERFSNEHLIQWWNDLVDALQYTHRKHIIHRDIKPSNLFLTEAGQIKLFDFGVAKIKDNITVTQTGSRMGTLMYMSPEQVYDVKNLTYKTDVYSLAVTFYHLVTGNPPYDNTKISDFEIQESIVRKSIDLSILPLPWKNILPAYFSKNPEERKELQKIEEGNISVTDDTIYINPIQVESQLKPATNKTPYQSLPQKRRQSPFYFLFPVFVILGLVVFALNKDRVMGFFSKQESPKNTTTVKKKSSTKPNANTPSKGKNIDEKADTINSQGADGNTDQVIVSVDPQQTEAAVKTEINDYYRSRSDCNSLSRFFEDTVKQYYNKSNEPLSAIKKECQTYHGKWKFTEADIDDGSYVFTYNQNGKIYIDFSMLYRIKQNAEDEWIPYNIDVAMVINENNKIERIVERRIEKL